MPCTDIVQLPKNFTTSKNKLQCNQKYANFNTCLIQACFSNYKLHVNACSAIAVCDKDLTLQCKTWYTVQAFSYSHTTSLHALYVHKFIYRNYDYKTHPSLAVVGI